MAATIAYQDFQAIARTAQERAVMLDGQALAQYRAAIAGVTGRLAVMRSRLGQEGCDPALAQQVGLDGAGLLAISVDGTVTCRTGLLPPIAPPPYAWFERVRGGAPFAIEPLGKTGWTVAAVPAGGGAAVAAVLPPAWLGTSALPEAPDRGDAVWLLDSDRNVLVSAGDAAAALPPLDAMVRLIGAGQLAIRHRSAAGGSYAYATTLLPGGWRLITATSAALEEAAATRELLLRLAELAILLLAGVAAVVLGADVAFGTPLRQLSGAVRRWQAGGAFEPGDLSNAPEEVVELAGSFADATAVLRERGQQLATAKEQQDLLLLEVHHRVKNNLQVIASLLNLQGSRIREPAAQAEFQAARDRVRALATLHRHLYSDGELNTINMRSFLTELCGQLFQAMGTKEGERITLAIDAPELRLSGDQAVPLALIVTEAVTNSVRYAFPGGRTGHIAVSLTQREGGMELVISDDGVGIPAGKAETEAGTRDGIGLQLIRGFSRQLGASLAVEEGPGTRYIVRLSPPAPRRPKLDAAKLDGAKQDGAKLDGGVLDGGVARQDNVG